MTQLIRRKGRSAPVFACLRRALSAFTRVFDAMQYPTECSGPPHLLGPWGSAGRGVVRVASRRHFRPATCWCACRHRATGSGRWPARL